MSIFSIFNIVNILSFCILAWWWSVWSKPVANLISRYWNIVCCVRLCNYKFVFIYLNTTGWPEPKKNSNIFFLIICSIAQVPFKLWDICFHIIWHFYLLVIMLYKSSLVQVMLWITSYFSYCCLWPSFTSPPPGACPFLFADFYAWVKSQSSK
jgi:hypothetical protein